MKIIQILLSTRVLKPNLCDYVEAYILVDCTIRAANAVNGTRLALKNRAPFTKCNLEINDVDNDNDNDDMLSIQQKI